MKEKACKSADGESTNSKGSVWLFSKAGTVGIAEENRQVWYFERRAGDSLSATLISLWTSGTTVSALCLKLFSKRGKSALPNTYFKNQLLLQQSINHPLGSYIKRRKKMCWRFNPLFFRGPFFDHHIFFPCCSLAFLFSFSCFFSFTQKNSSHILNVGNSLHMLL